MLRIIKTVICLCLIFGVSICYADTEPVQGKTTAISYNTLTGNAIHGERSFSSPEETWAYFRSALLAGNYESAKECYYHEDIKNINVFEKMGEAKTRKIILQMKSFEKVYQESDKGNIFLSGTCRGSKYPHMCTLPGLTMNGKLRSIDRTVTCPAIDGAFC